MMDAAEPMSVFDVERRARLEAGLPWGNAGGGGGAPATTGGGGRRRNLLQHGDEISTNDENQAKLPINTAGLNELRAQFGLPALTTTKNGNLNFDDDDSPDDTSTGLPLNSTIVVPSISPLPLHVIPGMGRESMAYLTSIINNYENLPDMMVMMHGHESSWHSFVFGQAWGLKRLRNLPLRNLSMGFMQLGCMQREESFLFPRVVDANHESANGPRWKESMAGHFMQAWMEHLGEAFGDPLPPRYIQAACELCGDEGSDTKTAKILL